jgi:hypothetical protein
MVGRRRMRLLARISPGWQFAVLGVLVSLWIGLSGLLLIAKERPEAFIATTFGRFSRADLFEHPPGD